MNTVTITGNLTEAPELRYTPTGVPVASFSIGNNEYRPTPDGGERILNGFFPVTVWRDAAERAAEELSKGDLIVVTGRLVQERWQTEDGENRSRLKITALSIGPALDFHPREREQNEGEVPADVG